MSGGARRRYGAAVGPRITFVGGGSRRWIPTLLADVANTPSLQDAAVVLHDVDPTRLPLTQAYGEHLATRLGIPMRVRATTDLADALTGADFVVVCISTGGLESMRIDLEVPARHGITMPTGDTVGPSGISRALRNVPVMLEIARTTEQVAADGAWLLNLTNPLTVLTRTCTRETGVRAVGLCHEVTVMRFVCCALLDCGWRNLDLQVTGVNHLPVVTEITVDGEPRLGALAEMVRTGRGLDEPRPGTGTGAATVDERPGPGARRPAVPEGTWTKRTVVERFLPNFELLRTLGALPAAGARHVVEFFPWFIGAGRDHAARWHAEVVTIEERRRDEVRHTESLERELASGEVPRHRSLELAARVMDALVTGRATHLPLNIPNHGHCPDLPPGAVVEAICRVDGDGIRGRDTATAPPVLAACLRQVVTSQELTLEAALRGDRDLVLQAMLCDPLAGRLDWDAVVSLTDELLGAGAPWLPQFGAG